MIDNVNDHLYRIIHQTDVPEDRRTSINTLIYNAGEQEEGGEEKKSEIPLFKIADAESNARSIEDIPTDSSNTSSAVLSETKGNEEEEEEEKNTKILNYGLYKKNKFF